MVGLSVGDTTLFWWRSCSDRSLQARVGDTMRATSGLRTQESVAPTGIVTFR
jgi:hypothetical protein